MTTVEDSIKHSYQAPLSERFVVWMRNLYHWRTKWAVNHLSKQLQRDPGFRQSWHANIAMPIYDDTRKNCACLRFGQHDKDCHRYGIPGLNESHDMPIEQANHIADKLMKHLFNA